MAMHKSLEYAYPTSDIAREQGHRDSGCWFVAEYEYQDDQPCEEYVLRVVGAFAGNESGRDEAIAFWKSIAMATNVWSCKTVRNPHWLSPTL